MAYNKNRYLLLSGIRHFAFCRRQWALIHIGIKAGYNPVGKLIRLCEPKAPISFNNDFACSKGLALWDSQNCRLNPAGIQCFFVWQSLPAWIIWSTWRIPLILGTVLPRRSPPGSSDPPGAGGGNPHAIPVAPRLDHLIHLAFGVRRSPQGERRSPQGSVDWNRLKTKVTSEVGVAPRKGSVDWNKGTPWVRASLRRSLPARGAWIEISQSSTISLPSTSLPARGAWIEIWVLSGI